MPEKNIPPDGELAPAKINLYLHVTGRRDDGYHLLDSLVAFADIGDRLDWDADGPLQLLVTGPFAEAVPTGNDNLVLRALAGMADLAGRSPCGTVKLDKQLPVAAGIGGGSSDAAAMIRLAARAWDLRLDDPRVTRLALSLGADVPVCLNPAAWRMTGIGEEISPAPALTGLPIVLANPGIAVPTPAVFKERQGPFSEPAALPSLAGDRLLAVLATRRNDLAPPAERLFPAIAELRERLSAAAGCHFARMSGSGATCFGLFATEDSARRAAIRLTEEGSYWAMAGCLL